MFESIKKKIAQYIIKRKFLSNSSEVNFNNFFKESVSFLVIMPINEHDFVFTFEILKYLKIHDKSVTVLCQAPRVNTIPEKEKFKIISYGITDVSKFYLPEKVYLEHLEKKNYDVIIDLNHDENLFCSAMSNFFNSKYRVGFKKNNSDNYYNFQIQNDERNSEISYRNLLNSLQMF